MRHIRLVLAVVLTLVSQGQLLAAPPNVILFLADDLGYGDLGCFGHSVIQSPNLDAFAKQGVRLTQCYAGSAVCSPSRSALLTGRTHTATECTHGSQRSRRCICAGAK